LVAEAELDKIDGVVGWVVFAKLVLRLYCFCNILFILHNLQSSYYSVVLLQLTHWIAL